MSARSWSGARAVASAGAIGLCLALALAGCSLWPQPQPPHATIYVDTQANIAAIDAATGAIRWTFRGRDGALVAALSGDILYTVGSAGGVYALDARTGRPRWQDIATPQAYFTSCVASGDMLYATANPYAGSGHAPASVYAFDASTGALRWRVDVPGAILGEISAVGDRLYFLDASADNGAGPTLVYALRMRDGTTAWRATATAGVRASLSTDATQVYVSSMDGAIEALGTSDGALHWRRVVGSAGAPLSTVAPNGATLYVGDGLGNIYALRAGDGAQVWKRDFPNSATDAGQMIYTPSIVGGALYLSSVYSTDVYALSPADGSTRWSYDTQGYNTGQSPVIAQSAAYTISGPYTIDILDAHSGSSLARYSFSSQKDLMGLESLMVGPPLAAA